jgi:hypothetical protein
VKRTHTLQNRARRAKVSNGGDRLRETVKRTHLLSNRAHRAKVSSGGDRRRETVKRTHTLSSRAHRAKVSNGGDRRGETVRGLTCYRINRQPCIVEPCIVELAIERDLQNLHIAQEKKKCRLSKVVFSFLIYTKVTDKEPGSGVMSFGSRQV